MFLFVFLCLDLLLVYCCVFFFGGFFGFRLLLCFFICLFACLFVYLSIYLFDCWLIGFHLLIVRFLVRLLAYYYLLRLFYPSVFVDVCVGRKAVFSACFDMLLCLLVCLYD